MENEYRGDWIERKAKRVVGSSGCRVVGVLGAGRGGKDEGKGGRTRREVEVGGFEWFSCSGTVAEIGCACPSPSFRRRRLACRDHARVSPSSNRSDQPRGYSTGHAFAARAILPRRGPLRGLS